MFAYRSCATSSSQQQRQVHLESFFYAERMETTEWKGG